MKTRPSGIRVVTMGCSKNLVDSETLLRQFKANELKVYHNEDEEKTDTVIINTCGFINDAKQESIDMILRYAKLKSKGLLNNLYVMGCLSERYTDELIKEIPEIDNIFGVNEFQKIIGSLGLNFKNELLGERLLTTPAHYAYLKISEGCSRSCSFCAIPIIRGPHISKPIAEIVAETELLAISGVKELILVAQDLSYYGYDLNKRYQLSELLKNLEQINGPEWIRLHYAFPANFPLDILSLMINSDKICRYLDLPLQHISDRMLKLMRRGINKKNTIELIGKLRSEVPGIALRTTMLVGHPGETEKDFNELMDFIRQAEFERLGVFTYSHEDDTYAFKTMKNSVPMHIMQSRADELMALQQNISEKLNFSKVGGEFKVLVDRREGDFFIGRTEYDSPEIDNEVLIKPSAKVKTGEFFNVKITGSDKFDLFGEVI